MKRLTILTLVIVLVVAAAAGSPAAPVADSPQVTQLKQKLRNARLDLADAQNQIDAQNSVIEDQAATIQRLRTRLANQPDPLDVITNRDPDGQWAAMVAIWRAFPTLNGALCGYDKSNTPPDGIGLTLTSFTFYRWQGC